MKTRKIILAAMLVLMAIGQSAMAQTYQSAAGGNWTSLSTWQVWDDPNWVAATSFPGQTSSIAVAAIVVNSEQPTGTIATLDCAGATLNGTLTEGVVQPMASALTYLTPGAMVETILDKQ